MKKFAVVMILIIALSALFYFLYRSVENKPAPSSESNALNEEKIMEIIQPENQQERQRILQTAAKSPDQVIALNSLILKMTYGKELTKDELNAIVQLQREQFAEELLSQNSEMTQQLKIWLGSEKMKENKTKIVDYKALAPYPMEKVKYDGVKRPTVKISVVYYTNVANRNQYVDYLLYEDENAHWKIVGWAKGEEFLLTE